MSVTKDDIPILEVKDIKTHFATEKGVVKAVDGVSFALRRGKILGIVGESGSGKSMMGLSIIRLIPKPGKIVAGDILYRGTSILDMDAESLRRTRGGKISMVFQDPMMTLNPVLRIDTQMVETVLAHENVSRKSALQRAREMLSLVGIAAPNERLRNYPHQLSGGMRQRIAIAIGLCNGPDVVIADEPTTALDVTIQAQILSEVQNMCATTGTSLIWITHDLSVVAGLADEVCVMYAGKLVEYGSVQDVIGHPAHPYTQGLIQSSPSKNEPGKPLRFIKGMTPNVLKLPPGCAFVDRCNYRVAQCDQPQDLRTINSGHLSRCHLQKSA